MQVGGPRRLDDCTMGLVLVGMSFFLGQTSGVALWEARSSLHSVGPRTDQAQAPPVQMGLLCVLSLWGPLLVHTPMSVWKQHEVWTVSTVNRQTLLALQLLLAHKNKPVSTQIEQEVSTQIKQEVSTEKPATTSGLRPRWNISRESCWQGRGLLRVATPAVTAAMVAV